MAARACSSSCFSTTLWVAQADGLAFGRELLASPPAAHRKGRPARPPARGRADPVWRFPAAADSRDGIRVRSRAGARRVRSNHARSTSQGCGCRKHHEWRRSRGLVRSRLQHARARHQIAECSCRSLDSRTSSAIVRRNVRRRQTFEPLRGIVRLPVANAAVSSTTPPPIVTTGENMRMMKRSPGSSSAGSRSTMRAYARPPGFRTARAAAERTSASISAVPAWKCTGARCFSGFAEGSSSSEQSSNLTARNRPGSESTMPRTISAGSMSARFTAVRWPGRGPLRRFSVDLHAAHAQPAAGWIELDFLFAARPRPRSTCPSPPCRSPWRKRRDRSAAGNGPRRSSRRTSSDTRSQLAPQIVETRAGGRADRNDGRTLEKRTGHELVHFQAHQVREYPDPPGRLWSAPRCRAGCRAGGRYRNARASAA